MYLLSDTMEIDILYIKGLIRLNKYLIIFFK